MRVEVKKTYEGIMKSWADTTAFFHDLPTSNPHLPIGETDEELTRADQLIKKHKKK